METEKADHEEEESLIITQLSTVHHQTRPLINKLLNGNELAEAPPHQINGDANWGPFKPPSVGMNQMKRHYDSRPRLTEMQDLFDQTSHVTNGDAKHDLSDASSFRLPQAKKLRGDLEINGDDGKMVEKNAISEWDKEEAVGMESNLDGFQDHMKPADFDCDVLPKDRKNANFTNGDLFSLSRSKQMPVPNGATVTASSMEDTPGDLLQKTLSQYYPDRVSIAPQSSVSVEIPASTKTSPEPAPHSPSLTSGLLILPPISASGEPDGIAPEVHNGNNYDNAPNVMNGYRDAIGREHQQQPYPLQEVSTNEVETHAPAQGENLVPSKGLPPRPSSASQDLTYARSFSDGMEAQDMYPKSQRSFSQDSYPLRMEPGAPGQTEQGGGFSPFVNVAIEGMVENKESDQGHQSQGLQNSHDVEYGAQHQLDSQGPAESSSTRQEILSSASSDHHVLPNSMPDTQNPAGRVQPQALMTPCQTQGTETKNKMPFDGASRPMQQRVDPYTQMEWIDLNSAQRSQPVWKDYHPQQAGAQQQGHMPSFHPQQGFPMQAFNQPGFQQQGELVKDTFKPDPGYNGAQKKDATDWPQPSSTATPTLHAQAQTQASDMEHMLQQQTDGHLGAQTPQDRLCENSQDVEQILSSSFLQQHPPPYPQSERQVEIQNLQSPIKDTLSVKMPRPQDQSQRQLDTQLLNRFKLEEYIRLEKQLKSPNCPSSPAGLTPTSRNAPAFPEPSLLPNTQPPQKYSDTDRAVVEENYKLSNNIRQHCSPTPGNPKQYSQPNQNHPQSHLMDYPHPPATQQQQQQQEQQQQPQFAQGAPKQQVSGDTAVRMFPKMEPQDNCARFQQGQLLNQTHRDLQRHAALRMHLLQKQERHGHPQNLGDLKHILQAIKTENGPRFNCAAPLSQGSGIASPTSQAVVKQEPRQLTCQQMQEGNIIATMEHQLRQYQPSPLFDRKSLVIKSPNKVKVETSGPVTILSATANVGREDPGAAGQRKPPPDLTPTKKMEPSLNSFIESPMKLLDTPIKNLLDTPVKTQYEIPSCHCVEQLSEKDEGPYYTHLGAGPNLPAIREMMEKRFGQTGSTIRLEKVVYTGKEGKSTQGCPIAKWVIRRGSVDEKLLVLVRERTGHSCETACIIVAILVWEGIPVSLADRLYIELSETLRKHGAHTNRRCALNEERTCACQGLDPDACGASFSFGCSWSMYYNGCKFARSKIPRKFKLLGDDPKEEERLEQNLQNLATLMAPTYKQLAPDAYGNQVEHEHRAMDCRLGLKEGRPFSGVTACMDFCAHAHRDLHNMPSGSTVVCTLTREDNREVGKIPEDEQLHVLPLYKPSSTDEFGSVEAQQEKIKSGAIQVLTAFRRKVRMLAEPAKSCRQRKLDAKRAAANKLSNSDTANAKAEKALLAKLKQNAGENQGTPAPSAHPQGQNYNVAPQPGHPALPLSLGKGPYQQPEEQKQLQSQPNSYASSPHPASYPRFPNHADPFPSTSQPHYPQSPASGSPYPSALHVSNSYLTGSNAVGSYPGSLNPSNLYQGYQCNGNMSVENYHPYYGSNPKHLDMYHHKTPQLCPQQRYMPHQHFGVNYPTPYGEKGIQVNGYSNCSMTPGVHPMGAYSTYSPNAGPEPHFLESISRPPSAHPSLEFAAASKSSPFSRYPNPYLAQNPQMFHSAQDSFRMQSKPEMNLNAANGIGQVLPPLGSECPPPMQHGYGLPNGITAGTDIKQEPGLQAPDPREKEDVWSDNEHNFLDPDIGGVALAPSHGSILIECAKRELHATTPLKNPDRTHPTRISLVFYQHKNMNEAKHGLALWEAKMAEKAREKEEDAEKHGAEGTPSKAKKVKREPSEAPENTEPPYKRFIQTLKERSMSSTTNTYVCTSPYAFTKVTGPYNRFI